MKPPQALASRLEEQAKRVGRTLEELISRCTAQYLQSRQGRGQPL